MDVRSLCVMHAWSYWRNEPLGLVMWGLCIAQCRRGHLGLRRWPTGLRYLQQKTFACQINNSLPVHKHSTCTIVLFTTSAQTLHLYYRPVHYQCTNTPLVLSSCSLPVHKHSTCTIILTSGFGCRMSGYFWNLLYFSCFYQTLWWAGEVEIFRFLLPLQCIMYFSLWHLTGPTISMSLNVSN